MLLRAVVIIAIVVMFAGPTFAGLEEQVKYAKRWYEETVRGCGGPGCTCCGMRGDANCSHEFYYWDLPEDMPTIGDISVIIDAKFISNTCGPLPGEEVPVLCSIEEADVNVSADPMQDTMCDDITIGDISMLIDYLFITGPMSWDMGYGFFPSGEGKLPPCP